jgi:hypothetical protein
MIYAPEFTSQTLTPPTPILVSILMVQTFKGNSSLSAILIVSRKRPIKKHYYMKTSLS